MLALLLGSQSAQGGITDSAHDFSAYGWSGGEICIVCHTPHNADTTVSAAPLWDHEVSNAVYVVYSSPTMDVPVGQPGPISKLCLSCHDGTVAADSFGGNAGGYFLTGNLDLETNLQDDHPIGIDWDHQTDQSVCSSCHDVYGYNPALLRDDVLSFSGPLGSMTLECGTCHDAHNSEGFPSLLRRSMVGSELCLVCHGK